MLILVIYKQVEIILSSSSTFLGPVLFQLCLDLWGSKYFISGPYIQKNKFQGIRIFQPLHEKLVLWGLFLSWQVLHTTANIVTPTYYAALYAFSNTVISRKYAHRLKYLLKRRGGSTFKSCDISLENTLTSHTVSLALATYACSDSAMPSAGLCKLCLPASVSPSFCTVLVLCLT